MLVPLVKYSSGWECSGCRATRWSGVTHLAGPRSLGLRFANGIHICWRCVESTTPPKWVRGNLRKLTDEQHEDLIAWIGDNLQPSMEWSTCIGVIDAACSLVQEAIGNANFTSYYTGYAVE